MMLWQHSGEEQISSRRWKAGWGQGVVCSAHDCYGSKMGAGAKRDEAAVIIVLSKTDKQPERRKCIHRLFTWLDQRLYQLC